MQRQTIVRRAVFSVSVVLGLAVASSALAQRAPAWSLGIGVGAGGSYTPAQVEEAAVAFPAADLTFAIRPRPSRSALVVGASATGVWIWPSGDDCYLAPDGTCLPSHAGFILLGVFGGWESRGGRLRATVGPAFALSDGPHPAFALQSRLEGSVPIVRHLSLTGLLRGAVVPNYRQATYSMVGAGIGIRLHGG